MRRRARLSRDEKAEFTSELTRAELASARSSQLPRDNWRSPPPRPTSRGNDPYGRAAVVSRPPGRRTAPFEARPAPAVSAVAAHRAPAPAAGRERAELPAARLLRSPQAQRQPGHGR